MPLLRTTTRAILTGTFLLVAVGAFVIGSAQPAGACSCASVTDEEALRNADAAFSGALVDVISTGDVHSSADPERFVFVVRDVYKGDVRARQTVVTPRGGESCGLELTGPGPHLVFAFDGPGMARGAGEGELYSHLCSGTRPLERGAVPVGFTPSPPIAGDTSPPDGDDSSAAATVAAPADDPDASPWLPLAVGAVAVTLVATVVWRVRARS